MPSGKVYKYGDNVDTDVIIPARYLNAPSPDELAKHCMEDIDATFAQKVQPGDIIVGGANFGCGSSREHAPIAIRACGVSCVIAPSWPCWPVHSAWSAACSAMASAPATWTPSPSP